MARPSRYDPEIEEMLRRTQEAIRRSQELIAKARELQRQCDQLRGEARPASAS